MDDLEEGEISESSRFCTTLKAVTNSLVSDRESESLMPELLVLLSM